jgi:cellobiose transport system substrate-binding protein
LGRFFDVGRDYRAATGNAWFDQSGFVWNAMVNQLDEGYYSTDGELNVEDNAELRARWDLLAGAIADGLSAAQSQWDWNGGASFVDGTFATFMCPGWMLGVVEGFSEGAGGNPDTGWDFADAFPGGYGNWGGSFLAVSANSENKAAAAASGELADRACSAGQAVRGCGHVPEHDTSAIAQLAMNPTPREYFNDAPVAATPSGRHAQRASRRSSRVRTTL